MKPSWNGRHRCLSDGSGAGDGRSAASQSARARCSSIARFMSTNALQTGSSLAEECHAVSHAPDGVAAGLEVIAGRLAVVAHELRHRFCLLFDPVGVAVAERAEVVDHIARGRAVATHCIVSDRALISSLLSERRSSCSGRNVVQTAVTWSSVPSANVHPAEQPWPTA